MTPSDHEPSRRRYSYGSDPSQHGDLHLPAGERRAGTVVLFHGGWWGPHYGADHLEAAAVDLAERGWVVWNVEYRRIGLGGGYPQTLADAAAAIDYLATLRDAGVDASAGPVVTVGHSAGGHLAVWAAGRATLPAGAPGATPAVEVTGAVSLAGVLDLSTAARAALGSGAALELMGGGPEQLAEQYAVADPLRRLPIPAAVRCVHARADDRVPFSQSVSYTRAATALGQDAQLAEVEGTHFSVADPSSTAWPAVLAAVAGLTLG